MKSTFKETQSFTKRKAECERIRAQFPDRIPVICEKAENSDVPDIDKIKYIVPYDLTVGQFVYVIRKRIVHDAHKSLFIFVDDELPPVGALMSSLYAQYRDQDGYLYVTYSGENTFGSS